MTEAHRPSLLELLGRMAPALFVAALLLRLLTQPEPVGSPLTAALPTLLGLAATGFFFAAHALKNQGPAGRWPALLMLLTAMAGASILTDAALLRGLDLVAMTGLALALANGMPSRPIIAALLLALLWSCLVGHAQATHQHETLRRVMEANPDPRFVTEMSRAFGASRRPSAALLNANVFAGVLVLVLPLMFALRGHALRMVACIALLGGLVLTESAGATLSLVLALAIVPTPWRWMRRLAALIGACGVAALTLGLSGVALPWLAVKVQTFSARLDYHRTAIELLPTSLASWNGFGSYADLSRDAVVAGREWSAFAHNGWLETIVETGLLGLALAALLLLTLLRSLRTTSSTQAESTAESETTARSWPLAITAGAAAGLAVLAAPAITPLPLAAEATRAEELGARGLGALLAAAVFAFLLPILMRRLASVPRRLLLTGAIAFALHSLVDFDVAVPGACWAFATVLGVLASRSAGAARATVSAPRARAQSATIATVAFALVPLCAGVAASRDRAVHDARLLAKEELRNHPLTLETTLQRTSRAWSTPISIEAATAFIRRAPSYASARDMWSGADDRLALRARVREAWLLTLREEFVRRPGDLVPDARATLERLEASGTADSAGRQHLVHLVAVFEGNVELARQAADRALQLSERWPLSSTIQVLLRQYLAATPR